jgi:hypothetical protein
MPFIFPWQAFYFNHFAFLSDTAIHSACSGRPTTGSLVGCFRLESGMEKIGSRVFQFKCPFYVFRAGPHLL